MVVPGRSAVAVAYPLAPTMRKAQPAAALKRSRLRPVLAQRTRLVPESAELYLEALPARSVVEQRKRAGLRAEWEPRLRALRERFVAAQLLPAQAWAAQRAEAPIRLYSPAWKMLQGYWVGQRWSPQTEAAQADRAAREYRCRDRERAAAAVGPGRSADCHGLPGSARARRLPLGRWRPHHRFRWASPDLDSRHRCCLRRWRSRRHQMRLCCRQASLFPWLRERAGARSHRWSHLRA
jgi:hypothetical protein